MTNSRSKKAKEALKQMVTTILEARAKLEDLRVKWSFTLSYWEKDWEYTMLPI